MKVKRIILLIFWLAVFVGVVFVVVRAGSTHDKAACEQYAIQIKVDNTADTLIYHTDIENIMLKQDSIVGKPYNEIDIYALETILEENPYISDVTVFGDMSNTLHVTTTQRTPIVRIINKLNKSFYLDETGNVMSSRLGVSAQVITVSGNIADTLNNYDWSALLDCVKYINNDTFLKSQIGQIYIENEHSYFLIPVIGNHIIIFGEPEYPAARLERLKLFYQKGMDEEKWKTYKTLNLKYKNQVVCTK